MTMSSPDDPARLLLRQMMIDAAQKRTASLQSSNDTEPATGSASQSTLEPQPESISTIDLFDPVEIRRKLGEKERGLEIEIGDGPLEPDARSSEEIAWERRLRALLDDSRNPKRRLVIANEAMIGRIEKVLSQSPNFSEVIGLVGRAAKLSFVTKSPLAIPPILLLGAPGIGKSFFAQSFAEAVGTDLERVAMDMLSDHGASTVQSLSWKAARPGRIALGLLESNTASPIFLLDEVDKANPTHPRENPLAFLHSVLEPENACRFADEYLTVAMRADHVIWILTANSTDALPDSILDRLTIFRIPEPDHDALRAIIRGIYAATNARFSRTFLSELDPAVIEMLLTYNPRTIGKLLRLAFGFAAEDARRQLLVEDLTKACAVAEWATKESVGFL
jgi:ATP-dependent Lon protease